MRKIIYLFALGLMFLNSACMKEDNTPAGATNPTTLNDLKAADSFNWSTSSALTVEVIGLPTQEPIKATLTLTDAAGNVYYSGFHAMSETLNLKLVTAKTITEMTLTFGAFKQKASITNGKIEFSFIPVLTDK